MGESSGGYGPLGHGAPVGRRGAHGAGSADGGCHDAPYYRTRGVTRGMRKGESELGVENSAIASWRLLKNKSLSLSVHFYIVLPATLTCANAPAGPMSNLPRLSRTRACARRGSANSAMKVAG